MPYLGEVRPIAFTFVPVNWMLCNGQTLKIAQYPALFALIGTYYGGDGRTTFCLPNLRQHVVVGVSDNGYPIGQSGGQQTVTLNSGQLPAHSHSMRCVTSGGTQQYPIGLLYAKPKVGRNAYASSPTDLLNPGVLSTAGQSLPHNNMQPYLTLNFMICINGTYPDGENLS